MAKHLTSELKKVMEKERELALKGEQERFLSRQGELSKLIEDQTIKRLEREIKLLKEEQKQGVLFDNERYLQDLSTSQREKEEEIHRRRKHYEELRDQLGVERERILKHVIPKRYTLRGEAQAYPVAVEIRFPGEDA